MADTLAARRRGPLAGQEPVAIGLAPPATRFIFRGSPEAAERAGFAFGTPLLMEACRASHEGGHAALWLGPDEWLLLAPASLDPAEFATALATALAGVPHAAVDVSHRQVGVEIAGPGAAVLLNAGCPLDSTCVLSRSACRPARFWPKPTSRSGAGPKTVSMSR